MAMVKKVAPKKTATKSKTVTRSTPALSSMVDSNSSVSIREIQNGFLISESGYTGKGKNQQYYSKEYFSATNPVASAKIKFGKK